MQEGRLFEMAGKRYRTVMECIMSHGFDQNQLTGSKHSTAYLTQTGRTSKDTSNVVASGIVPDGTTVASGRQIIRYDLINFRGTGTDHAANN